MVTDNNVCAALRECGGSDSVFHNEGGKPSVAIRWIPRQIPPVEQWIVWEAETHDEAGRNAAATFADRIRTHAKSLLMQADRIDAALRKKDG